MRNMLSNKYHYSCRWEIQPHETKYGVDLGHSKATDLCRLSGVAADAKNKVMRLLFGNGF